MARAPDPPAPAALPAHQPPPPTLNRARPSPNTTQWRRGSDAMNAAIDTSVECGCGCGLLTNGTPFRRGHHNRTEAYRNRMSLERYKGGRRIHRPSGYALIRESREQPWRHEHEVIAERVLGKPLPPGAEVHHVNFKRADNAHENLVICPNHEYHALLHVRTRALDACGHADWRKCTACKQWGPPEALRFNRANGSGIHPSCDNVRRRERSRRAT
jgi:hypothetical protein